MGLRGAALASAALQLLPPAVTLRPAGRHSSETMVELAVRLVWRTHPQARCIMVSFILWQSAWLDPCDACRLD